MIKLQEISPTKILYLTARRKWFDIIASGEKNEEYRQVKPYWITRIIKREYHNLGEIELIRALMHKETFRKDYNVVQFKNGYSKTAPVIHRELLGIHYGFAADRDWHDGPPDRWYFCLELGNIIIYPGDHFQIINPLPES